MFTKYWRSYPWFLQLFLFAMMVMIFLGITGLVTLIVIPKLTGIPAESLGKLTGDLTEPVKRSLIYRNAAGGLLMYGAPCLLFAYLTHPRPSQYLGFRLPGRASHWLLSIGVMLGFLVVSSFAEEWITAHFTLPSSLTKGQEESNKTFAAMLHLSGMRDRVIAFIGLSAIPAFAEELMFRGIMMRFARKRSSGMVMPIFISSFFFTMAHGNYLGMPAIFTAGILLAVIYWYTGSMWCNMLGHFVFNGVQVSIAFWGPKNLAIPGYVFFVGLIVAAGSLYALWKTRTPLPADWAEDFSQEEMAAAQLQSK